MPNAPLTTYLNLCTQYYDLDKPTAPEEALALYRYYAQKSTGKILEPFCGSGRYLLPLLEEGCDIEGFDASPQMLDALRTKATAKGLSPKVWTGFLEDFSNGQNNSSKYGLIFIPCGSFGLITDLEVVKMCLRKIQNQLNDDGLFVFEVETLKAVPSSIDIWRGHAHRRTDGKLILGGFLSLQMNGNVASTIGRYELTDAHQLIATEVEQYNVRLFDPDHMRTLLNEAGFLSIKMLKAFDQDKAPGYDDEVIVFECGKRV